jgi:hypothetical protein
MTLFRVGAALIATAALTLALAATAPTPAAAVSSETQAYMDWVTQMTTFYETNPDLVTTPGSGWKPFNRYRWFADQRMFEGELPAADARWKVWQYKTDLERRLGYGQRGGQTWFSLGPANFGGRVLAVCVDPTNPATVYVGTAGGGLWKTTDTGASWNPMTDELPSLAVGGVAVSPSDPNIVIIGTGEGTSNIDRISGVGILRSTDGGVTWDTTDVVQSISSFNGFHFVEANPINGTLLAGDRSNLWRSSDDGVTWVSVLTTGEFFDAQWKPGDVNTVFCAKALGSGANVKISTDDGLTWTKAGNGGAAGASLGKSKIALSAADPETIYSIHADANTNGLLGVYRSTDGGANWTLQATTPNIPGGQGWYNLSLTVDPANADRVIAGGVSLYRSTNGGVNFFTIGGNVHVDHHAAEYDVNGDLWIGSDGGMWWSDNNGTSFTDKNNGLVNYQFYDICVNNGPTSYYIMGGTQDQGTDKWSGTTTWSQGLGADGMVCNVSRTNGTTVYAEIQNGGHRRNTTSGVGGWSSIMSGITGAGDWVTPTDVDPNDGNRLYTETNAGIFRSTNAGNLWQNVGPGLGARWISISPVDGRVWTVNATPQYTTDDGGTWNNTSPYGFTTGGATKILAHPTDANSAIVTFSSYSAVAHVAFTTDSGVTWSDATGDFPPQPVNAVAIDPSSTDDWYIGTDMGVWKSVNGGVNWLPFETGFPNTVVADLEIQDVERKLVAGTHGRGAWEVDIPLGSTASPISVSGGPERLMLDRPAPNPINDRTMLRFAARSAESVQLRVYDVQGRLVSDLFSMDHGDGIIRTTPWFATDVPSGVYFVRLTAGADQLTEKIIVRK